MEYQTEIRQPHSLPVMISVPNYPPLAKLATQLQKLNEEALTAAGEVAFLQQEKTSLDYESQLISATSETFARLAGVSQQLAHFENRHATAQAQAKRVSEELGSLRHEFGFRFYRRRLLNAELAQAGQRLEMRVLNPGEKVRRSRIEVLTELDECVGWLGVWSDDPKLVEEATKIQTQLAEARQQQ